jgi:Outer membrane protein beta-barrel family/Carboxypeptidase regulatory-like domain
MVPLRGKINKLPGVTFKTICILLLCIGSITGSCIAQTTVTGVIVGRNNAPVAHANVLLLHSKDSSLVKGMLAATDGNFIFENIPVGSYLITSTFVGYKQIWSSAFYVSDNKSLDIGKLTLTESARELNAVTVTAKKPLYEQKPDRLVINVQNSITSAGNTALDVLERSPGVLVDRQNNSISLKGKDGVALMINGKVNYMPVAAAMELLKGMSAGTIEKIELITTPPANFDAEGNAGYINIVLKTNDHFGANGSYSASLGYGKGLVGDASVNVNYRKGKINIFGNLSYSHVAKPLPISSYTMVSNQGTIRGFQFLGDRDETVRNINGRLGLDYQLNKKTVFGILLSGYDNRYEQVEKNEILLRKNNVLDTTSKQSNSELNHWQSIGVNLGMQHDFREGSKLAVNADYIYYKNDQPFHYHSAYYNSAKEFVYDEQKISTKITPIGFWIGALDYSQKLGKKVNMETGVKGTIADFKNDLGFERLKQGVWVIDTSLTTQYKLNENYAAIYTSFDWSIDENTKAKTGLRYEYTNSNLGSTQTKNIVDRHYGNLFPVITLSRTLDKNNSINLSYSKRISRPTFNNLAPYIYYVNENTIITGNPVLQPSVSHTITTDYTFKKYTLSLSFNKQDHAIAIFQPTVDSVANKVVLAPDNFKQKLLSALVTIPVEITNWWNMQYSITGIWQQVDASDNKGLTRNNANININVTQNFRLPDNISVELSGFYQSRRLEGIYTQKEYGSLNIGIRKKLPGTKGALTFSANNILDSQETVLTANYPEKNMVNGFNINFVQRTFRLTWTRSFGNTRVKERRERTTGAEDEKGRVQ